MGEGGSLVNNGNDGGSIHEKIFRLMSVKNHLLQGFMEKEWTILGAELALKTPKFDLSRG